MSRGRREECGDFSYYDKAIRSCTHCDHLCDNHEYQGTTYECKSKCNKYFQRMQQPTPQKTTPGPTRNIGQLDSGRQDWAIPVGVISFLILGCILAGVGICQMKKKKRTCCRRKEERKPPVACSEEDGIDHIAESQKSLLNSNGPIRQAVENPHAVTTIETAGDDWLLRTFRTFGLSFDVIDQPRLTRSIDTMLPIAYTESGHSSYESNIVPSTVPKTFSETQYTSNGTNSTTPKVVYTSEGETDMNSTRTGTTAEFSIDMRSVHV